HRIQTLSGKVTKADFNGRMEVLEARKSVSDRLRNAEMDINFVMAEIVDEQSVYNELLAAFSADRDHAVAKTNLASFAINGALWAVSESLTIACPHASAF